MSFFVKPGRSHQNNNRLLLCFSVGLCSTWAERNLSVLLLLDYNLVLPVMEVSHTLQKKK